METTKKSTPSPRPVPPPRESKQDDNSHAEEKRAVPEPSAPEFGDIEDANIAEQMETEQAPARTNSLYPTLGDI